VKLYKYFAVDKNGVLFYTPDCWQQAKDPELPVILGLETKIFGPKPGKRYDLKELTLALNLLSEAGKNKVLKDYPVKKIDVINPANTEIFISLPPKTLGYSGTGAITKSENLQIKIGQDNIEAKVSLLAGLIAQERLNLDKIKYIDLRFRESVIKLKDAK
jgi:hypothetical protein